MRDFSFVKTDQPTMAEFNKRFGSIADFINNLGNEYVWAKYAVEDVEVYDTETYYSGLQVNTNASDFYYAASFHVASGLFVLDNPKKISWAYPSNLSDLTGKYCIKGGTTTSGDTMYKMVQTPTAYSTSLQCEQPIIYSNIRTVESGTLIGYVNSPNPNAYPVNDGYTYTPLGQLGNKVQIATGSYTGTGTHGVSNKNSLTFDFVPKLVIILQNQANASKGTVFVNPAVTGISSGSGNFSTYFCTVAWSENTVSWYQAQNATYQFNDLNTTFQYIAIG